MNKRTSPAITVASDDLNICCDVGMDEIHIVCPPLGNGRFGEELTIANRTEAIRRALEDIRDRAGVTRVGRLRVVAEPTGIYHQLLLRMARSIGLRTALVNAEHVVKMRTVVFGDDGKTDARDPHAIAAVADRGRLIVDRVLPEVYQVMRGWSALYQIAEDAMIDAKGRVHRALKYLFPDFDFSSDFLYSASGQAIMKCYEFDPHRLSTSTAARVLRRLRQHCRILRSSVDRLLAQASVSVTAIPAGACHEISLQHLRLAWNDCMTSMQRREAARAKLEELYADARRDDPRLPAPQHRVATAGGLARLFAELGPIDDFDSWRQILKFGGMNLRQRQSGRYTGQNRITHKGRPQLRRVTMQMILPLVRRGELFGDYYAQKTTVQKMPGPKAMTAVARKFIKMIWGWSHAEGAAFDAERVFRAQGARSQAA
jgi:transposase